MNIWVIVGLGFIAGFIFGSLLVDCIHSVFTNAAWHTVRCLAAQNVELFNELKAANSTCIFDEGEEWKKGNTKND